MSIIKKIDAFTDRIADGAVKVAEKVGDVIESVTCPVVQTAEAGFKDLVSDAESVIKSNASAIVRRTAKFSRVFPSGTSIVGLPATLALWSNVEAQQSPGQSIPNPGFSITLDPEWTTPGALIAVHTGDPQQALNMRPGETIHYKDGFNNFLWWNVLGPMVGALDDPTKVPFGRVAFLIGLEPGDAPLYVRNIKPRAEVCPIQWIECVDPGAIYMGRVVIGSGIRGYRISFWDDNNGDGSALVRPYVATYGSLQGDQLPVVPMDPNFPQQFAAFNAGWWWFPAQELDLNVTPDSRSFDREVVSESLMWGLTKVSVTNCTRVYANIEAYS